MQHSLAVIGCGNMAKAILRGICSAKLPFSRIFLYDISPEQYTGLLSDQTVSSASVFDAVSQADLVLLSVKPQNYQEVLAEIRRTPGYSQKLYISIGAGITSESVSVALDRAPVIRVLPNVPMFIGMGVSVICRNDNVSPVLFGFVQRIFESAGSVLLIDETDMNRMIGVTSSSPAYVFRFIRAIYDGAVAQGISEEGLLEAICDVVIGSATMLKNSSDSPTALISKVASKGGTTERALEALDHGAFDQTVAHAMSACTQRADELGRKKS